MDAAVGRAKVIVLVERFGFGFGLVRVWIPVQVRVPLPGLTGRRPVGVVIVGWPTVNPTERGAGGRASRWAFDCAVRLFVLLWCSEIDGGGGVLCCCDIAVALSAVIVLISGRRRRLPVWLLWNKN